MSLIWMEAVLPLGIIAGMLCVMGSAQYYIYKAAHGRAKHIGNDMWDVAMELRDKKLMDQPSFCYFSFKLTKVVLSTCLWRE